MSNVFRFGSPVKMVVLASDPSSPEDGLMWYNSTSGAFKVQQGGSTTAVTSLSAGNGIDISSGVVSAKLDGTTLAVGTNGLSVNSIANSQIAASAGIVESKLSLDYSTSSLNTAIGGKLSSSLASGKIFVGGAANTATAVTMSGDATIDNVGALTIASSAIVNSKVASNAAIAMSKLAELTTHNSVLVSNNSGVISESSVSSTTLGYLDATSSIQTQLNATEKSANKGAANGYAPLDSAGKVPYANLPSALMTFKGAWSASANSPSLADGTGTAGDTYRASTAGTQDLGSGNQTWAIGDFIIYNGSIWQHSPAADGVSSVNGSTGAVTVNAINELTGDVTAGPASGSQSKAATIANGAITNAKVASGAGIVETKLSLDYSTSSLNTAISGKIAHVSDDSSPALGGNLSVGAYTVVEGTAGMHRGADASHALEQQYIDAITLTASTTAVAAALTFAIASFEGVEISYKIKESSTSKVRKGTIQVATDGTTVSIADMFVETGDCGVTWSAAINTGNVELSYTTTANAKTMRADVKRFRV